MSELDMIEVTVQVSWKVPKDQPTPALPANDLVDAINDAAVGLGLPRIGAWRVTVDTEDPIVQMLTRQVEALRDEIDASCGCISAPGDA